MPTKPDICLSCIDYRYNDFLSDYLKSLSIDYYDISTAGSGLMLAQPNLQEVLGESITDNISIARSLSDSKKLYVLNHQDCGAFKVFLPNSGYPPKLGQNNKKELQIHAEVLTTILNLDLGLNISVGIIDCNGSVANLENGKWVVKFYGKGNDPRGLFYNPTNKCCHPCNRARNISRCSKVNENNRARNSRLR